MEVVVKGHHCEISDRFRDHCEEKLARLEKYDHRVIRADVEVSVEANPRLAHHSTRVEITIRSKGPVVRAEAAAEDKLSALDKAVDRLSAQARKAADRRRIHHGTRTPTSLGQAMAAVSPTLDPAGSDGSSEAQARTDDDVPERMAGPIVVQGDGPLVVREKAHSSAPMTLDQALYEMELVGHDFFLFMDKDHEAPAVVYRRKGYDYGIIRLTD